ncbi:thioredoxin-like protein [Tilletiaria anomala UBC 951]|uniref:Thioredoxin-like protein n=1 Tax=Tilletiaria anomala (strain ATCC 24038 / CBS 436.72 / UBC 951) TaxID=1037660 RepID=A0A066W9R9_TILAU|nr:thioredoxin-like protein [Tilletiaria anomala UBC 951]KDN47525.1 thioredoxin-like protein [Tilletiaria anomala UBC 951]
MAQVQVDPTQDTEFHDALRAHGIIPPKPPSRSPSPERPTASGTRASQLSSLPLDRIERALQEGADYGPSRYTAKRATVADEDDDDLLEGADGLGKLDEDEERILLSLRSHRMREMRVKLRNARFGRVYPISRVDYMREVTEASKEDPSDVAAQDEDDVKGKGKGTGVICFLYKDGMDTCDLLAGYLETLAAKYPSSKFVSIVGDKCIPNYPDKNLPTLLIYRGGELHRQIVGLRREIGLDGMNTKCADIELLLTAVGAIERGDAAGENGGGTNEEAEMDDTKLTRRGIRQGYGTGVSADGRAKTQEEEDAELDWDL